MAPVAHLVVFDDLPGLVVDHETAMAHLHAEPTGRDHVEGEHLVVRMVTELENDRHIARPGPIESQPDIIHVSHFDHEVIEHLLGGKLPGRQRVMAPGFRMVEYRIDDHAGFNLLTDIIANPQTQYVRVEALRCCIIR